jgi:class 3 adenylate cyclase
MLFSQPAKPANTAVAKTLGRVRAIAPAEGDFIVTDISRRDVGGEPLRRDSRSAERRQATVLFADMVGSTAISERIGEEATFALVQAIYDLMAACVREQGGSVKDFTGDGLMALFGVPVALEDAPLRACRAGLLIQERLAAAASDFEARSPSR